MPVWTIGRDDEVTGPLAAGHNRRSLAAFSAHRRWMRREYGGTGEHWETAPPELAWATFATTCGCTEADHRSHLQHEPGCDEPACDCQPTCVDNCDDYGLPPCGDPYDDYTYEWIARTVEPGTPGALPVVRSKGATR